MGSILSVLQAVIGGLLVFIIIGWVLMQRIFPKTSILEKIIYSITLSITITLIIGVILSVLSIFTIISFIIAYAIVAIAIIILSRFI